MILMLDYISVCARICELKEVVKEVKNEIENMEETIEDLGIFWVSDAQAEYAMRLTADLFNARTLVEKINDNIESISNTVRKFDETDSFIRGVIEEM